jgi:hypothetical protein
MNRTARRILLLLPALAVLLPAAAVAQEGLAVKLGAAFNSTVVEDRQTDLRPSDAAGWSAGLEYVLPGGLGVGVSGYTAGSPDDFDVSSGSLVFLGEATYFVRLPGLPVTPYGGVHFGLGTYRLSDLDDARPTVDFGDRGYQFGVRVQLTGLLGADAQYRRVSESLRGEQASAFERTQYIFSVTLF